MATTCSLTEKEETNTYPAQITKEKAKIRTKKSTGY